MNSGAPELLIIADAGPLIGLAKIDRLLLLRKLAHRVAIPDAVWREVVVSGAGRPEADRVRELFLDDVCTPDTRLFAAYRLQLDDGEAAALAVAAQNPGALLLMDDARGRRLAAAQGFRVLGTLGLLVRAKRRGEIGAILPEIEGLLRSGIYLNDEIVTEVLRVAGETRPRP